MTQIQFKKRFFIAIAAIAGLMTVIGTTQSYAQSSQAPVYRGLTVQKPDPKPAVRTRRVLPSRSTSGRNQVRSTPGYTGLTSGVGQGTIGSLPGGTAQSQTQGGRPRALTAAQRQQLLQRQQQQRTGEKPQPKTLEQRFSADPAKLARLKALRDNRKANLARQQQQIARQRAEQQRAEQFRQSGSIALP